MSNQNKEQRKLTRKSFVKLDDNITLLDYKNNYDVDKIINSGVSNMVELVTHIVNAGKTGFACSSFDAFTPEGDHTLARNFDFRVAPCLVLWTHPDGHYASLSVVDANFLTYGEKHHKFNNKRTAELLLAPYCCVDGINEKGLSIAVLQIKAKATKQNDKSKLNITTTAMIRCVLDTCATVDEAVEFIKSYNMHDSLFCCYHYQLADASGRTVIVEYIDNVLHVYEKGEYGIAGSVYEDDDLNLLYAANYSLTKDIGNFKIEQHGEDRTDAIKKVLKEKNGTLTELESMDLLNYVRLDYDHPTYPWRIEALWSAVYNSNKQTLKLVAHTDYKKVYTFSVDRPCEVLNRESIEKSAYEYTEWSY